MLQSGCLPGLPTVEFCLEGVGNSGSNPESILTGSRAQADSKLPIVPCWSALEPAQVCAAPGSAGPTAELVKRLPAKGEPTTKAAGAHGGGRDLGRLWWETPWALSGKARHRALSWWVQPGSEGNLHGRADEMEPVGELERREGIYLHAPVTLRARNPEPCRVPAPQGCQPSPSAVTVDSTPSWVS